MKYTQCMAALCKKIYFILFSALLFGCSSIQERTVEKKQPKESTQSANQQADDRVNKFKLQLENADSILLVGHERTYGPIFNEKDGSYVEAKPIVENDIINTKVINITSLIEGKDKESLITILTSEVKGAPIDVAKCFDPHHALIVISKGQVGYIELCFGCGGVAADKIDISSSDFDNEKWDKIYKFIESKIPIKE